jgi:hypothetical protein
MIREYLVLRRRIAMRTKKARDVVLDIRAFVEARAPALHARGSQAESTTCYTMQLTS